MFDFGFWEIVMIMVIALIVVGPERLPGLARTAGFWVGKAKRFVSDVKSEIDQELAAEELKKVLDKQTALEDVYEIIEETRQVGQEIKQDLTQSDTVNDNRADDTDRLPAPSETSDDKS